MTIFTNLCEMVSGSRCWRFICLLQKKRFDEIYGGFDPQAYLEFLGDLDYRKDDFVYKAA